MKYKNVSQKVKLFVFLGTVLCVNASGATPWSAGLNLGLSWPNEAGSTLVSAGSGYPADNYKAESPPSVGMVDIAAMMDSQLAHHHTAWGIHYNFTLNQAVKGTLSEFDLPNYVNYNYSYDISRQTLLASYQFDVLANSNARFQPYVLLGAGLSRNTASHYTVSPFAGVYPARTSADFSEHTNIALAFEAMVGVTYELNPRWKLDANYNYLSAGKVGLGAGVKGDDGPQQALQYNTIMTGARYLF